MIRITPAGSTCSIAFEPTPTLTRGGMPASPHQIAVLSRPPAEAQAASRRKRKTA